MGPIELARHENPLVGREVAVDALTRLLDFELEGTDFAAHVLALGLALVQLRKRRLQIRDGLLKFKSCHRHKMTDLIKSAKKCILGLAEGQSLYHGQSM